MLRYLQKVKYTYVHIFYPYILTIYYIHMHIIYIQQIHIHGIIRLCLCCSCAFVCIFVWTSGSEYLPQFRQEVSFMFTWVIVVFLSKQHFVSLSSCYPICYYLAVSVARWHGVCTIFGFFIFGFSSSSFSYLLWQTSLNVSLWRRSE